MSHCPIQKSCNYSCSLKNLPGADASSCAINDYQYEIKYLVKTIKKLQSTVKDITQELEILKRKIM